MVPPGTASDRVQLVFDMFDVACAMKRQHLKRSHPDASEVEIERLLAAWVMERPEAPDGDGVGRVRTLSE